MASSKPFDKRFVLAGALVCPALLGCGSDRSVECAVPTLSSGESCVIDTDGLYIEPSTQCVRVWDGQASSIGSCTSTGDRTVTVSRSHILDGKRGLVVSTADDPLSCVFRECQ